MDFWAQRCLEEIKEAEEQQVPPHKHTTDRAMADTIMDFLFASQDATTAAVVWVTVLMAEYPDVLEKVQHSLHDCIRHTTKCDHDALCYFKLTLLC